MMQKAKKYKGKIEALCGFMFERGYGGLYQAVFFKQDFAGAGNILEHMDSFYLLNVKKTRWGNGAIF